ncbi:probable disease resistance protein At1g61300 [Beta vulgaris subsp. vulgaris]|uniref:probable disease resistance protein At1g61300 n=1 Tax=Beta vulgaris subsp. vulgaris TaxID=3555 RepID=UPI002036743B|nr:probable disease resistance protein At1g61300 [Beta vulgaris subsp. vulgaris]
MDWLRDWLSDIFVGKSDVGTELDHTVIQPIKKQRKEVHHLLTALEGNRYEDQSIVKHGQEQGSSSKSQLTGFIDWLSGHSSVCQKMRAFSFEIRRLIARASDVRKELEHAEIQPGKKRRIEVQHWLTDIERIKGEIRGMAMYGQEQRSFSSSSKLVQRIENITKEVSELIQQGRFPNGLVLHDHDSTRLPFPPIVPWGRMFALNSKTILQWLEDHNHCIMGVYGMGGVGKTTLLMSIYNVLQAHCDIYGLAYWVAVSQNCSVHKLQKHIAKELGVELCEEDDERKRAAILHKTLSGKTQTVLILDDMWKPFLGNEVGIPLEGNNCKIILSTRSLEVCRRMGCKIFVIKAEVLQEGEAWDLFRDKLGDNNTLTVEAEQLARSVARECGGLPLAVATMARSMSGIVDIYEWQNALTELRKPAIGQVDMKDDVLSKLQYSYDRLNDKMFKNAFLSCVLYFGDDSIKRTELIDLWVSEGLLDEIERREEQVIKGHTILNRLENSCLLETITGQGNEKSVKMHDLIRDMAIMITHEIPHVMAKYGETLLKVPEKEHWSKDLEKVSLCWNHIEKIPCGMAPMTPKLTVLMLNGNPLKWIPESFFAHMTTLRILGLSGTDIERLPDSLSDLENLRMLLLKCDKLTYVPSLEKLTKLRVLELPCNENFLAPRGIESLKSLEKLTPDVWETNNVTCFNEVVESWQVCELFWEEFRLIGKGHMCGKVDAEDILRFCDKKVVVLGVGFGDLESTPVLPSKTDGLFIKNVTIEGSSSLGLGDVFPSLARAKDLKALVIRACTGLEHISASPNLLPAAAFWHLKKLVIEECPEMKVVFSREFLQQKQPLLPNLEHISVFLCDRVEEIFETGDRENEYDKINATKSSLVLPKLRNLSLSSLPKLSSIYRGSFFCTSLEVLLIHNCSELVEIFETPFFLNKTILSLPNLRELRLTKLPKLSSIYRGLLLCTSMQELRLDRSLNLNLVPSLSRHILCDSSTSTLVSLPTDPSFWDFLHRNLPKDAHHLSDLIEDTVIVCDIMLNNSNIIRTQLKQ